MQGPFRLRPGPSGDLAMYASATSPGAPVRGHVVLCHDLPRPRGSAADLGLTFPALADRLTRESGWRVVTATLRGAGESEGDFSPMGWLEDLTFAADEEIPESSPRLVVGFGFGGVLALRLAARDERVAGVACLGTPAELASLVPDPVDLLTHCRRTGVITTEGFPASVEAWFKELSFLHPAEDAALLKGRPLLLAHGANDPDVPVAEARGARRRGDRALRAPRRARRRPLAPRRPAGDRHPGGLVGAAPLTLRRPGSPAPPPPPPPPAPSCEPQRGGAKQARGSQLWAFDLNPGPAGADTGGDVRGRPSPWRVRAAARSGAGTRSLQCGPRCRVRGRAGPVRRCRRSAGQAAGGALLNARSIASRRARAAWRGSGAWVR